MKGRKIHALIDSEGVPMRVVVDSATIQHRDGAGLVLDKVSRRFPWLELIWADGGCNAWQVDAAVAKMPPLCPAIVKRSDDKKGFVVLARRWVVERTFSWFGRNRRLAKDFENFAAPLDALVILAAIQPTVRRLARNMRIHLGIDLDQGGPAQKIVYDKEEEKAFLPLTDLQVVMLQRGGGHAEGRAAIRIHA